MAKKKLVDKKAKVGNALGRFKTSLNKFKKSKVTEFIQPLTEDSTNEELCQAYERLLLS